MSDHPEREALVLWLEDEHAAPAELAAHLTACADCRAAAETLRRRLATLRARAAALGEAPPAEFGVRNAECGRQTEKPRLERRPVSVIPHSAFRISHSLRRLPWRKLAAHATAAAVLLALLGGLWLWQHPRAPVVATVAYGSAGLPAGRELRQDAALGPLAGPAGLRLGGGTLVCLDRGTEIERLAEHAFTLRAGRVHVNVAAGSGGFAVETPAGRVTDLGTVFVVEVAGGKTTVTVVRGKVLAAPAGGTAFTLAGGQAAALAPGATAAAAPVEPATAWVRALVFPAQLENEPLERVFRLLEGVSAYRIEAPAALRELRVTGAVGGLSTAGILDAVAAVSGATYRVEGERVVFK